MDVNLDLPLLCYTCNNEVVVLRRSVGGMTRWREMGLFLTGLGWFCYKNAVGRFKARIDTWLFWL